MTKEPVDPAVPEKTWDKLSATIPVLSSGSRVSVPLVAIAAGAVIVASVSVTVGWLLGTRAPMTAEARLERANAALAQGRLLEAGDGYVQVLSERPDDATALWALAEVVDRLGEPCVSLRHLERYASLKPADAERVLQRTEATRARCLALRPPVAEPASDPTPPAPEPTPARLLVQPMARMSTPPPTEPQPRTPLEKATQEFRMGNLPHAMRLVQEVLQKEETQPAAHKLAAGVLVQQRKYCEAKKHYERFLELDPNTPLKARTLQILQNPEFTECR
ncbi:MAG: tetratricopeptide repeat protein [Myxococcota bacterium]